MSTFVEVEGVFVVTGDDIEPHLDEVMSELLELDCGDPSISVSLETGRLSLSLMFDQEERSIGDAVEHALGAFRTAIHAAGGGTPEWPGGLDLRRPFFKVEFESVEMERVRELVS